jgi:hypothetical protein
MSNGRNNSKIKYQICGKKQNRYTNTQIRDRSLSFLGTGTSMKSGGAKIVLRTQTFPRSEFKLSSKCFPLVSKIPTHITGVNSINDRLSRVQFCNAIRRQFKIRVIEHRLVIFFLNHLFFNISLPFLLSPVFVIRINQTSGRETVYIYLTVYKIFYN